MKAWSNWFDRGSNINFQVQYLEFGFRVPLEFKNTVNIFTYCG
jgi:hypothetical protein